MKKIKIEKRYIELPISCTAQPKRLSFFLKDHLVFDLDVKLDMMNPDLVQYIDMSRFLGQEFSITVEPEMAFSLEQADAKDDKGLYGEKYRPTAHFTTSRGWINDPNGLCKYNNRYHLFFQYNPAGTDWGNMHWGHAVSIDLMHWKEKDIALYPDEFGTMFSGSAIVDARNVTGLKQNEHNVILLYYTAAGGTSRLSEGKVFTQCLAYSVDGGETFQKYHKNPMIDSVTNENRDPKVVFHPSSGKYYLALYLSDNKFALFISSNLLDWKWHQDVVLPEDGECPDFYPLKLEETNEEYWIFSGASDRYLVGNIRPDGTFQPIQTAKRLHYGMNSYAAQTFSGITDGRVLRMAWNTAGIPYSPFNSAMCFPTELSLHSTDGEKRVCIMPVKEIEQLYLLQKSIGETVIMAEKSLSVPLSGRAQDIFLRIASSGNMPFTISLLGLKIEIHPSENMLKCKDSTMPLFINKNEIRLRILTDSNAVEIFAHNGEAFSCIGHIADYNLNQLIIKAGNEPLIVYKVSVAELKNIWNDERKNS